MSPQQRIARSNELTFALIAFNIGWCVYLVAQSKAALETNPIWTGALGATPFHSPDLLGAAIGMIAVLMLVAWVIGSPLVHGLALVWGMGTWGVLSYSFIFTAITMDGIGAGGTVSALFTLFIHYFMLRYRDR